MKVSILIVTRDRAADLKQTLDALAEVVVPDGMEASLLVVDNGSSDETPEIAGVAKTGRIPMRCVRENSPGLSHGRNRGLAESSGDVILFTDDDVRFPADWLERMVGPFAVRGAKAVCGGVRLAPHLTRPWMTPMHRSWLASTEWLDSRNPQCMVGANMAISREVLGQVPGFDVELGAGALGACEETLFCGQLLEAGHVFHNCLDVCVEHHFHPSRLLRRSWMSAAEKQGVSHAWLGHHWKHWNCRFGAAKVLGASLRLGAWRACHPDEVGREEGCEESELKLAFKLALARRHVRESGNPRKYECRGLIKAGGMTPRNHPGNGMCAPQHQPLR